MPTPITRMTQVSVERPGFTLFLLLVALIAFGAGLSQLSRDPSVDAFVPADHPAALARDAASATFGLEDPIVIGLAAPAGQSAFTPEALEALVTIDREIRQVEGVKKNDVVSLASENAIRGDAGDLIVEPIIEPGPITGETARLAKARFDSMPMLRNLLASENGDMLTIIAPVDDPNQAEAEVEAVKAIAKANAPPGIEVHVAGVAAMNARLASMVNGDTRIFIPAAILTVIFILFTALRRFKALLGPIVVIIGSTAIGIGLMGWLGAKYYLITTALPVVIMAIAVADALHISTYYLKARADDPTLTARQASTRAIAKAWLPVTLTSETTIAAFIGLSFGAAMKPISEFGYFAAVGVAAAWILSLTALPAILVKTDLRSSTSGSSIAHAGWVDKLIERLTEIAFLRPRASLLGAVAFAAILAVLATDARFDYERQHYFTASDEVRISDQQINARLGGINFLDVVVTAPEEGGLMTPEAMRSMASLRQDIEGLALVEKVGGVDEYISLMHEVLTDAPAGTLPTETTAPGQYMFLYEASGAPEDFKQEIDYSYSQALIRAQVSTDSYSRTLPLVHSLEERVNAWSLDNDLSAEISGRVAVNDGWMTKLSETHFRGLGMALFLVFLTTWVMFRSLTFSGLAMIPVLVGVMSVYAAMGALRIDIAPATSMTAAIATGLGVDFGIHLISTVRRKLDQGASLDEAFGENYNVVARACFYSAIALGTALMVVCLSSAPPLRWFGFLVAIGALGSLIGAIIIVPAIWASSSTLYRRTLDNVIPV